MAIITVKNLISRLNFVGGSRLATHTHKLAYNLTELEREGFSSDFDVMTGPGGQGGLAGVLSLMTPVVGIT